MRKERIRALANRVEQLEWGCENGAFNMERVAHPCGTPACLAGWTIYLFGNPAMLPYGYTHRLIEEAALLLDLDPELENDLFVPEVRDEWDDEMVAFCDAEPGEDGFISPRKAAAVLRHLADTEKVNWRIAP